MDLKLQLLDKGGELGAGAGIGGHTPCQAGPICSRRTDLSMAISPERCGHHLQESNIGRHKLPPPALLCTFWRQLIDPSRNLEAELD